MSSFLSDYAVLFAADHGLSQQQVVIAKQAVQAAGALLAPDTLLSPEESDLAGLLILRQHKRRKLLLVGKADSCSKLPAVAGLLSSEETKTSVLLKSGQWLLECLSSKKVTVDVEVSRESLLASVSSAAAGGATFKKQRMEGVGLAAAVGQAGTTSSSSARAGLDDPLLPQVPAAIVEQASAVRVLGPTLEAGPAAPAGSGAAGTAEASSGVGEGETGGAPGGGAGGAAGGGAGGAAGAKCPITVIGGVVNGLHGALWSRLPDMMPAAVLRQREEKKAAGGAGALHAAVEQGEPFPQDVWQSVRELPKNAAEAEAKAAGNTTLTSFFGVKSKTTTSSSSSSSAAASDSTAIAVDAEASPQAPFDFSSPWNLVFSPGSLEEAHAGRVDILTSAAAAASVTAAAAAVTAPGAEALTSSTSAVASTVSKAAAHAAAPSLSSIASTAAEQRLAAFQSLSPLSLGQCHVFTSAGCRPSSRVLLLDMDGTLIRPMSGKFCNTKTDWKPAFGEAQYVRLRQFHAAGYKIVIISNQGGISKGQTKLATVQGRFEAFQRMAKVPLQAFIAPNEDMYRKPWPGMWMLLQYCCNAGIAIDRQQSLYVGDAAGRPARTVRAGSQ